MKPETKRLVVIFGCILLLIYVVVVCAWANFRADTQLCAGLEGDMVRVDDPAGVGFVKSEELTDELRPVLGDLTRRRLSEINLDSLRTYLLGLDKIESAEVMRLNNNRLRISVVPLVPVARVWEPGGRSYYVNREGKSIKATSRYHLDVPQIAGRVKDAPALLPLLDYLNEKPDAGRFITMIQPADTANIILVPGLRGHVINLGDATNIADKFARLRRFYSEVLPAKGWEFYDTISLKWDGQIVATRRHGKLPDLSVPVIDELEHEEIDLGTVEAPNPINEQKNP